MAKQDNVEITNEAVKFAGEYVSQKFKRGVGIEKHLVVNTVAHGYYMGATEAIKPPSFWGSLFGDKAKTESWLTEKSIHAANYYLKKKNFKRLNFAEQALIKASLCYGFQYGYKSRTKVG